MCPKTEEERALAATRPYAPLVGKLLYLSTCTRPDIAYAVRELSRFVSNHGELHWKSALHLLRYIKGTKHYGIMYGNIDEPYPLFKTFADSDWATGEKRRSITGYIVMMGGGPIAWASKQQNVIALSTAEAEYIALSFASRQTLWLRSLSSELSFSQPSASPVFCDNRAAIYSARDPTSHSRLKHIDLRFHFIRHIVNGRLIDVFHIPGTSNIADLLTKGLPHVTHHKWISLIGLHLGSGGVMVDEPSAPSMPQY
jgi:hypothetical protein